MTIQAGGMRPKIKQSLVAKQDNFMSKLPGRTDGFQKAALLKKKLNHTHQKTEIIDDIMYSSNPSENDQEILAINFLPKNY